MRQTKNRRWQDGLTLIELLIALVVFAVVLGAAYSGIMGSLTVQVSQESTVSAQGKMRRIVEVLSQELRSAVFGSIIDTPYNASDSEVSFLLLTGGAGYPVARFTSGATQIDIVAPSSGLSTGSQVLVADPQGRGVLTTINSVTSVGGGLTRIGLSCGMPMAHTANTLLFGVEALGVRYDDVASEMRLRMSLSADEQPFAFDIEEFRVDYVYTADGQDAEVRSTPVRSGGGIPVQSFTAGGITYELSRLQIVLGVDGIHRGNPIRHNLTSQIELLRNQDYALKELTSCI